MVHICTEVRLPPALGPMDNGLLALGYHAMALVGIRDPRSGIAAVDEGRLLTLKCLFIWRPFPHMCILGEPPARASSVWVPDSRLIFTARKRCDVGPGIRHQHVLWVVF